MSKRKIAIYLGFLIVSNAFAGVEDWVGKFNIKGTQSMGPIEHSPTGVHWGFIHAGECMKFGKGAQMNDITFKEDVRLCTKSNIDEFTKEVSKIGKIDNKYIKIGPTYSNH